MGNKCKICGAELKKEGELCNNCMNQIMKEEETKNDVNEIYSFKPSFVLGYQLSTHIENLIVAIIVIAALIYLVSEYFWESMVFLVLFLIAEGLLYAYDKYKIMNTKCSFYSTKLAYDRVSFFKKRRTEIRYEDVKEFSFSQRRFEKIFNIGTIHIHTASKNLLERHIYIESVKNVQDVFNDVKEKIGGDVN